MVAGTYCSRPRRCRRRSPRACRSGSAAGCSTSCSTRTARTSAGPPRTPEALWTNKTQLMHMTITTWSSGSRTGLEEGHNQIRGVMKIFSIKWFRKCHITVNPYFSKRGIINFDYRKLIPCQITNYPRRKYWKDVTNTYLVNLFNLPCQRFIAQTGQPFPLSAKRAVMRDQSSLVSARHSIEPRCSVFDFWAGLIGILYRFVRLNRRNTEVIFEKKIHGFYESKKSYMIR